ncbi:MAG: tRNA pseudouridine(13) synthase TruD [Oceanospirillales bacterium LUC14_002_19_P2]|nr:MAG: tRNA pseudouridine(13) synthase TruD [Oceanospirillales bacterium LUC14_002_19_P2]
MSDWDMTLPRAGCDACGRAAFKVAPEDFRVEEILPFEPCGEGEHLYLWVEKVGQNTQWVARNLARIAGITPSSVGYAGLKDRQGVTLQWFSLQLPGKGRADDLDWSSCGEGVSVLKTAWHNRKLRQGALSGNRFEIRLQDIMGNPDEIDDRLRGISLNGVPNYFGMQRFGFDGGNLDKALAFFARKLRLKRDQKSIMLSAARSWLFNQLLAQRVREQTWSCLLDGDVLTFRDSHSLILPERRDATVSERFVSGELHNTGPLWGRGSLLSEGEVNTWETSLAERWPELCHGLENAGMNQERRALRVTPESMDWCWVEGSLLISFFLPKGTYATAVLNEVFENIS